MGKIIYGQYDQNKYPLKRFYFSELPLEINDVLYKLNQMKLAIFRGGLAFVFLMNANNYLLKDLDMIALDIKKENILDILVVADILYINKNTFGDFVLTAFWKDGKKYIKLDILLCNKLPSICEKNINGKKLSIVSISYIWRNRLEKIAEKNLRKHSDEKTLNHYKVANELSKYLLHHKEEIFKVDIEVVSSKLLILKEVLSNLIVKNDLEDFLKLQIELIGS